LTLWTFTKEFCPDYFAEEVLWRNRLFCSTICLLCR